MIAADNNAINDILLEDEEEDTSKIPSNSFQEALREGGATLFNRYVDKTSNLSHENINGIIRAQVLNDYMDKSFGHRFQAVDELLRSKKVMVVSHNGFGIESLIKFMQSIQVSFQQEQIPERMKNLLGK